MFGFIFFILLIVFVCLSLSYILKNKYLIDCFKRNNVIVFGKKGCGKDLLFQYVINKRKKKYHSNISYGGKYYHIDLNNLELIPNTYDNFINGCIVQVDKNNELENSDVYISDGGIYLPSQYDTKLHKTYPSMTITYALSRHLYNSNVHVNVQNLGRLWKGLREQADTYIMCKRAFNLPFMFLVKYNIYDRYNTAMQEIEPLKVKKGVLKSKDYTDTRDKEFKSLYGDIRSGYFIILKTSIKYDTRIFEKYVFKKSNVNVLSREHLTIKGIISKIFRKRKNEKV